MGQAYLLLAVVLLLFMPTVVEAESCVCADDAVKVRTGATTTSSQIHVLYPGECLPSYGSTHWDGVYLWRKVNFKEQVAFVPAAWTINKNCEQSELHPTYA